MNDAFERFNPFALLLYFLASALIAAFFVNPVITAVSLVGSLVFFLSVCQNRGKTLLLSLLLFIIMALVNPIFSHNGKTVLFLLNDNPITLEAILFGVNSSAIIVSVLLLFRCFTEIMTSGRLLYIFGIFSPKLALILSMSLRYVPMFSRQARRIKRSQKVMGAYGDGNSIDRLKADCGVLSAMTTWALENGIITAESMDARGFLLSGKTHFRRYGFSARDAALIFATTGAAAITVIGLVQNEYLFYPQLQVLPSDALSSGAYAAYAFLVFIPSFLIFSENIKWKYYLSKV